MSRFGTLFFGMFIGVIGAIALLKFPELTKTALTAILNVLKEVYNYVQNGIV